MNRKINRLDLELGASFFIVVCLFQCELRELFEFIVNLRKRKSKTSYIIDSRAVFLLDVPDVPCLVSRGWCEPYELPATASSWLMTVICGLAEYRGGYTSLIRVSFLPLESTLVCANTTDNLITPSRTKF